MCDYGLPDFNKSRRLSDIVGMLIGVEVVSVFEVVDVADLRRRMLFSDIAKSACRRSMSATI